MNRRWFPLLLILLLALALRLINLGGRSLWYDEAFAVLFSEKGLNAMLYGTLTPVAGGASDIHPLLYYSTLNIWMDVFGQSAFAVRLLSVVLGVATVSMMYVLARELFGEKTALAAAFITALAPFHVQYSQETRMYALLGLLLVTATWCFVKAWRSSNKPVGEGLRPSQPASRFRDPRLGWWLAFGVLAALAMYTQQLAAFYLVALGLVPLIRRRWDQFRWVVLAAAIAIILYLPWLVNLPGQFHKVQSYYWIDKPGLGTLLRTVFSFLVVSLDIPKSAFVPALVGAVFLAIFLVVQVIFFLRRRRAQPDRKPLLFALWLAAFPPGLMWLVSQIQPVYLERSLLPSALILYLALGWFFTKSGIPRPITSIIGVIGIALVGVGLYYQYTWATFPNSPFSAAVAYIHDNWQDGDVVIHQNKISALPIIYYDRSLPQRFLGDTPGSSEDTLALPTQQALNLLADACVQVAAQGSSRIWWVVFDFAQKQYADANRPEYEQELDWLNAHYTPLETQKFNDLDVVLFANPHGDLSPELRDTMKRFPRLVWLFALVVSLVTSLPYIVGFISTPEGWRYSGAAVSPDNSALDFNSNLAVMWQGNRGQWSQHDLFTDEPHPDLPLVQGFYVALGELARLTPFSLVLVYHLARFVLTIGMVLAIWSFASRFFEKPYERWLATLFATVVSGWSGLLLVLDPATTAQLPPIEFWLPNAFNLLGALYNPDFAAAVILQIVVMLAFDDWVRLPTNTKRISPLLILTLALAAEAIVQPYVALLFVPLLMMLTAYHVFSAKHLSLRRARWLLIPFAIHIGLVLYQYLAMSADPIWAKIAAQNLTLSPPATYYVLGYLPFIIPIALGARIFMAGEADDRWWLPILWVGLVAMLLYAPFPMQWPYLLGVQTPLAVMAAYGWSHAVLPRFKPSLRILVSIAFFSVASISLLAIILVNTIGLSQPRTHVQAYDLPDEVLAYDWLRQVTSPQDLVLVAFDQSQTGRGNRLVGAIGHHVFIGHPIQTIDFGEKAGELKQFYNSDTADDWRRDFLKRIGAAYIWYDEYARQFGDWNPVDATYLTAVFHSDTVTIWKVN